MSLVGDTDAMDRSEAKQLLKRVVRQTENEAKRKQEIVIQLRKLAEELDRKQRDMNIAKTAFASGGILGTGLTIAGIAAAPFTFGLSLGLTVGGVAVGVSSGLGGLATTIADWIINSNTMKDAQAMVDDYQKTVNDLVDLLQLCKDKNCVEFQRLVSEELADMDDNQRLTLETIFNGMKTGAEVLGSAGRSTAVAGAVAARATIAVGKTMMETLETGMQAVKIGGVVLSVLTVPLDLHAMITNSIKIHKNAPSETAEEIRKLASHLEQYRMVSSSSENDSPVTDGQDITEEIKSLKREVEKAIPDLRKMEQNDEDNRRRTQKLNRHLKRLVENVPIKLNQLAEKYDHFNNSTNVLKFLCLATQLLGTILIVVGTISAFINLGFDFVLKYGVVMVIGSGIFHLILEMYTELTNSSIWRDAETELERCVHTIQVLTDVNSTDDNRLSYVEDIFGVFRTNLHNGSYVRRSHMDFTLIAFKLIIDVCTLLFFGRFGTNSKPATSSAELEVLVSLETAVSFVAYPINVFGDMHIDTAAAFMYILTMPMTAYLLLVRLAEMRGKSKSKVAQSMRNLGEDFCIRFNHICIECK